MCLQRSEEGGESLIAYGAAIYNAFCRERPDLLDICYRGFHHQRRGNAVGGMLPYTEGRLPIFGFENGLFHLCWDRLPMEWAQEEKGEPITARSARPSTSSTGSPRDLRCTSRWPSSRATCSSSTTTRSEEHTSELQSLMRNSYAVF